MPLPLLFPEPQRRLAGRAGGSVTGLLVLLRHGQSRSNLEDRFTGWQDVGLTEEGREGACQAAQLFAEAGLAFDAAFSSRLIRAVSTLRIVLEEMGQTQVPVRSSWRLNERHYGALQGLEKAEAEARYSEERVRTWRRNYHSRPPEVENSEIQDPSPDGRHDEDPLRVPSPLTESLEDVSKRVLPYWFDEIAPSVTHGGRALVVAHGNSLRALVKHLDNLSDDEVEGLEIPPASPLVYEFEDGEKPARHYRLGED